MKRAQHDQAGIDEQLGGLADAADILDPVGIGEAEIAVERRGGHCRRRADGVVAVRVQRLLDQIGDGRLARAGQAGEPQHAGSLLLERGARRLVDERPANGRWWRGAAPKSIMPAPTVALVKRSIRMKPPVSRLSA